MIETDLNSLWFLLIAVLWIGYFFLEGFDFGVGILLPFVGRDDLDRRVAIRTVGPHWMGTRCGCWWPAGPPSPPSPSGTPPCSAASTCRCS